jgi:hypothetical protein
MHSYTVWRGASEHLKSDQHNWRTEFLKTMNSQAQWPTTVIPVQEGEEQKDQGLG